jgi:hypothetical protein
MLGALSCFCKHQACASCVVTSRLSEIISGPEGSSAEHGRAGGLFEGQEDIDEEMSDRRGHDGPMALVFAS